MWTMPATRGAVHLALFTYVIVTVGLALAEAGTSVVRKQDGGVDLYAASAGLQHRNLLHGGVDHTANVAVRSCQIEAVRYFRPWQARALHGLHFANFCHNGSRSCEGV